MDTKLKPVVHPIILTVNTLKSLLGGSSVKMNGAYTVMGGCNRSVAGTWTTTIFNRKPIENYSIYAVFNNLQVEGLIKACVQKRDLRGCSCVYKVDLRWSSQKSRIIPSPY